MTRSPLHVSLVLVGSVVLVACGGAAGAPAASPGDDIATPVPPARSAKTIAKEQEGSVTAPAASKSPKDLCAQATPIEVKVGRIDSANEKESFAWSTRFETGSLKAKDKTLTMADLEALAKKSGWQELLEHADDISPAQRGAAWDKLLERAAIGYMDGLTSGPESFEGFFMSQGLLKRYAQLGKSKDFMAKRASAAKVASEQCLQQSWRGQRCIDMMQAFLKAPGADAAQGAQTAFEFGKIVRRNQNHYVAVPFFKSALDQDSSKAATFCADADMKMAVIAGLSLPPDYDNAKASREIAAGACFAAMKEDVKKLLGEAGESGYTRDNTCAVLKAKNAL